MNGLPVRLPMVDIHTVGAGGGSLAWLDRGGALRVGPESAGADPGPACYGRGGTRPTVTDANLLLGRLPAQLAGGLTLDHEAAARAMDGIDPAAVVEVVNAEMLRALRVVSVERGHDPRDFALVAFGGAGPLHACALAEELGVTRCSYPSSQACCRRSGWSPARSAATMSGLWSRPSRRRASCPRKGRPTSATGAVLRADGAARLRPGRAFPRSPRRAVRLRRPPTRDRAHRRADSGGAPGPQLDLRRSDSYEVAGPSVVDLPGATCWVPAGWRGRSDMYGTLILERA